MNWNQNDLDIIQGKIGQLNDKLRERYDIAKELAERELEESQITNRAEKEIKNAQDYFHI